ncbi:MAG: hypothetical protein HC841_00545, partial [Verrucomicrobiae bacterium]|nr:hypothetical protein [Verrucomicrobiae bacterium]
MGPPISVDDLNAWMRIISDDYEDDLVETLIHQAVEMVETDTELSLMPQTWRLTLDQWPEDFIELRRPPVTAVSSITYVDSAGSTETLAADQYLVEIDGKPGTITRAFGVSWPALQYRRPGVIKVTFTAGY